MIFSCCNLKQQGIKHVQFGEYILELPVELVLMKNNGIDSQVGEFKYQGLTFYYDFGYYSNQFTRTEEEYLNKGIWRDIVPIDILEKNGITNPSSGTFEVISIKKRIKDLAKNDSSPDYVAKCKIDDKYFDYGFYVPNDIRQMNFQIDTLDNIRRKIVWSNKVAKSEVGINFKDFDSYNKSINGCLSISIYTDSLDSQKRSVALNFIRKLKFTRNKRFKNV